MFYDRAIVTWTLVLHVVAIILRQDMAMLSVAAHRGAKQLWPGYNAVTGIEPCSASCTTTSRVHSNGQSKIATVARSLGSVPAMEEE